MRKRQISGLFAAARTTATGAAGLLALMAAPLAMQAQSVTLYGSLSNFDVVNDTGGEVCGFEIEFHGSTGINSYYNWNRYGAPSVVPFPGGGGVYARWMSAWDPASQKCINSTPQAIKPTVLTGHQCIIGTAGYTTSGCEHFGISTIGNPTKVIYHWMVADPANPGQLKTYGSQVGIPAPVWVVQPPAVPGAPAVIVAVVDPPIPPPPAKTFGEAQWMKTYKTELNRLANLDELVADNPAVPQDPAQVETDWDLMQTELGGGGRQRQKRGGLGNGGKAVVRRFEFYKYAGAVDAITGEAKCADLLCKAPGPGEVGDFIGAQNAAANLNVPLQYPVTAVVVGSGSVDSSDRVIRCPGACTQSVSPHAVVTLTAKEDKGTFAGWTGACTGLSLTCVITVDSIATTTATFNTPFRLNVRINGLGTVGGSPAGSRFAGGTVVTLTAAPTAGNVFSGWAGACSGTALNCTVTITADTSVTANFSGAVAPPPPPPAGAVFRLDVKTNGNGSVASNPAGRDFNAGTVVTLTATPDAGQPWTGWTGGCTGISRTCTVTLNANTTVTANFR